MFSIEIKLRMRLLIPLNLTIERTMRSSLISLQFEVENATPDQSHSKLYLIGSLLRGNCKA